MKTDAVIAVASWEDRFPLGTERLIAEHSFKKMLVFYCEECEEWTQDNREKVALALAAKEIEYIPVKISFAKPVHTWHLLHKHLSTLHDVGSVLVDVTTMPRDTLWSIFVLLQQQGIGGKYVYHRPEAYHAEWLSRDPGRPRLVYKLSGVATLGQPTCLIITTGFDPERTRQLMWFYEPRRILLGFQSGDQFDNREKNVERHREALRDEYREFEVVEFELDAYSDDHGESILASHVAAWSGTHNVVMTSLGPKLGAVAIYRIHEHFPETALAYTPSNDFNREYSTGISTSHYGDIRA